MGGGEFFGQVGLLPGEVGAGGEQGGGSGGVLQENAGIGLDLKAGGPGFGGPDGVEVALREEGELVGVLGGDHINVVPGEADLEALRAQPGAGLHVLGVPELGCGQFLAAEVGGFFDAGLRVGEQGGAAIDGPGEHAHLAPVAADIGVEQGAWPHVGRVETAGEDGLRHARPGIVHEPAHLQTEALLEPAAPLARHAAGDEGLDMGDIREVPDAEHALGVRSRAAAGEGGGGEEKTAAVHDFGSGMG